MIIGGALAAYSIFSLLYLEKAVSYFPWNWLKSYTGISTTALLLIGIVSSAVLISVGVCVFLFQKQQNSDPAPVPNPEEPPPTPVPEPAQRAYQELTPNELFERWDSSKQTLNEMNAALKAQKKHALDIGDEMRLRMDTRGFRYLPPVWSGRRAKPKPSGAVAKEPKPAKVEPSAVVTKLRKSRKANSTSLTQNPPPPPAPAQTQAGEKVEPIVAAPKPRKEPRKKKPNELSGTSLGNDAQQPPPPPASASGEQTQKAGDEPVAALRETLKDVLDEQSKMEEQRA